MKPQVVHLHEENLNENNNNNNSINDYCNSISSQETFEDKLEPTSKIIYTTEFLILLKKRKESLAYPSLLSKFCTNVRGFWDPEKYFDLMKLLKKQNVEKESHNHNFDDDNSNYTEDYSSCSENSNERLHCLEQVIKNDKIEVQKDEMTRNEIVSFEPGEYYEVKFCSLNVKNDFYVNPVVNLNALKTLSTNINEYCNKQVRENQSNYNFSPQIGDIVLAKSIINGFWYRAKLIAINNSCSNVYGIDLGQNFDTINGLLLPCPQNFLQSPPFAFNICLTGVKFNENIARVLNEYIKKQKLFKIKILFKINDKYYVELYDSMDQCLNLILNSTR